MKAFFLAHRPLSNSRVGSFWYVGVFLITASVVAVFYGRSLHYGVLDYDTPFILNRNYVQRGLSLAGIGWAFSGDSCEMLNLWTPLTWISYLLDTSLFGSSPEVHRRTNLVLHAATSALLGLIFLRLAQTVVDGGKTRVGRDWILALIALLFALFWALHPSRLESVIWIAQRKDQLCHFFSMIAILGILVSGRRGMAVSVVALLFALLSKPAAVGLPLGLLFLHSWMQKTPWEWRAMLKEALRFWPFFALAFAVAAVTIYFQAQGQIVQAYHNMPMSARLPVMPLYFEWYVRRLLWPEPGTLFPLIDSTHYLRRSVLVMALVGLPFVWKKFPFPEWRMGLVFMLGMFLPVSGIVVLGQYVVADRYGALMQVGLLMALVISVSGVRPAYRCVAVFLGCVWLVVAAFVSHAQVPKWESTKTLMVWEHEQKPDYLMPALLYFSALDGEKDPDRWRALEMLEGAKNTNGGEYIYHVSLAKWHLRFGDRQTAMSHLRQALAASFRPTDEAAKLLKHYENEKIP